MVKVKRTAGSIIRKSLIYKTGVEYGDYTMNHIQGCSHGCKYPCYAFLMAKRFGKVDSYEEWIEPTIVENTLDLLTEEIPKFKDKISTLHMCFTTDPFMYGYSDIKELTLSALKLLNNNDIKCSILTKGLLPKELISLSPDNEYGITLVSLNEEYRKTNEPGAAPYKERLASLKYLHDHGLRTWVSIEPYPTPNIIDQDLRSILEAVSFTDKIIFGRTNYSKVISAYKDNKSFYNEQANIVIGFCKEKGIDYHIKHRTITSYPDQTVKKAEMVTLDENAQSIQHLCKNDNHFAKVFSMIGSMTYQPHGDSYDFLIHEIIEQMISQKAGDRIYNKLVSLCGGKLTVNSINSVSDNEVHSIGTSNSKIQYIRNLTAAIESGNLDFDALQNMPDSEVMKKLTSLRGIGNWTAKMYLIFVLDRQDILPFEDSAFLHSYQWLYSTNDTSPTKVKENCQKWHPYASIAARYLYRALDSGLTKEKLELFK